MRRKHQRGGKALRWAAQWLGLSNEDKRSVFAGVANALGVRHPTTKAKGYELCIEFRHQFRFAVRPTVVQRPPEATSSKQHDYVNSDAFLQSFEWRQLRMIVLKKFGARCQCCGATPKDGIRIHVDHIQPRRRHPELALTESNLQVLCEVCNHGKGSWDSTDWRADSQPSSEALRTPVTRSGDGHGHSVKQNPVAVPRLVRTQEARGTISTRLDQEEKKRA